MDSRQRPFHAQHRGTPSGGSSSDSWLLPFVLALSLFLASLMILTGTILGGLDQPPPPLVPLRNAPVVAAAARANVPQSASASSAPSTDSKPPKDLPSAVPSHYDPALQRAIEDAIGPDSGHLSVVVRRLTDGRTASVDGDRVFYAASTFKLAILYEAERRSSLGLLNLDDELQFSADDVHEDLGTLGEVPFEADGGVTIRNALRAMITVSDNTSAVALLHHLGGATIDDTLRQLGLTATSVNTTDLPTTASDMAILMAVIASGRGVSVEARAEMRALLLDQKTRFGIPQGLPTGIAVGNKTGTWEGATHDIAFVDAPGGAYVIAILSDQGWDWAPLVRVSKAVYAALLVTG